MVEPAGVMRTVASIAGEHPQLARLGGEIDDILQVAGSLEPWLAARQELSGVPVVTALFGKVATATATAERLPALAVGRSGSVVETGLVFNLRSLRDRLRSSFEAIHIARDQGTALSRYADEHVSELIQDLHAGNREADMLASTFERHAVLHDALRGAGAVTGGRDIPLRDAVRVVANDVIDPGASRQGLGAALHAIADASELPGAAKVINYIGYDIGEGSARGWRTLEGTTQLSAHVAAHDARAAATSAADSIIAAAESAAS